MVIYHYRQNRYNGMEGDVTDGKFPLRAFPQLISIKEFASRLGVSRDLIEDQCHKNTIPCVPIGKRLLIPEDAVETMLAKRGWVRA